MNAAGRATTPITALVAGDAGTARIGFLACLQADPDDAVARTGLALACAELGATEAAYALTNRPDLVKAGYLALLAESSAPRPDVLATWAGRRPQGPCWSQP